MKKDIIMFNMSAFADWQNGIVNRNRFVFEHMHKDERIGKILLVDFLPFTGKMMIKSLLHKPNLKKLFNVSFGQVYQYSPKCFVLHTQSNMISEKFFIQQLEAIILRLSFNDLIIWSYNPLLIKPFLHFHHQLLVFDTVDNWIFHESYAKKKKTLEENYQIIDEVADYIFTVSDELRALFRNNKDVHFMPNGVDISHFQQTRQIPEELKNIQKPIIGYVGTIQDRVDIDLIAYIVSKHPDKSFVFVGPIWKETKAEIDVKLKKYKNIFFLGRIPYEKTPSFIQSFDVCVITHKINEFIHSTNSMKMYEYLACQKPIVTTPGSGVEVFSDIAFINESYEGFSRDIDKALKGASNEKKEKASVLLSSCAWEKRIDKMLSIIM